MWRKIWSMSKWAWLQLDSATLLHGFRLSLGFKEHLSCISCRKTRSCVQKKQRLATCKSHDCRASMKEKSVSWLFRWLRTGAPGSDSVSTSCEEFANMYCPKVSRKYINIDGFLHDVFVRPCFKHVWTLFHSFSSFIGCISCFCEAWRERLPPDSNLSMLAKLCDSWDSVSSQGRKAIVQWFMLTLCFFWLGCKQPILIL